MTFTPIVVRADELQPGDFIDRTEVTQMVGPRGGRSRVPGYRVGSAVESARVGQSNLRHVGIIVKLADGRSVFLGEHTIVHARRNTTTNA